MNRSNVLLAAMVLATGMTTHAGGPLATGEAVVLKARSDGVVLAMSCPRGDFDLEFEVTCDQPGSVFDTVGINGAPVGSWRVTVAGDDHLTFNLWDGQTWHQLVSRAALSRGKPTVVRLERQGPTARFWVDGKEDASLAMATPLSVEPVFAGDFKGDEAWGAKHNIHQGMLGTVKVLSMGEPRLQGVASATNVVQPAVPGLYLVVDLSGSPSCGVSYLDALPPGGWTDEHKTTKLVLRKIPAGTFAMGRSTAGEWAGEDDEAQQHAVTLTKDFYIGVFEVTQRQWELVMGSKPSWFANAAYYAMRPVEQVNYCDVRENPDGSDDPAADWPSNSVVNAASFMGKLRAKTGLATFDLPTESQWEYACRAETAPAFNSGGNVRTTDDDLWSLPCGRHRHPADHDIVANGPPKGDADCDPTEGTALVGSYLPNQWGLYDMHGNVCEWCLDWHGPYPGSVSDPKGAASGMFRVSRGGAWGWHVSRCLSTARNFEAPSGGRQYHNGFRVSLNTSAPASR